MAKQLMKTNGPLQMRLPFQVIDKRSQPTKRRLSESEPTSRKVAKNDDLVDNDIEDPVDSPELEEHLNDNEEIIINRYSESDKFVKSGECSSTSSIEQSDKCITLSDDDEADCEASGKANNTSLDLDSSQNKTKSDQSEIDAAAIFNAGSTCSTPVPKPKVKKITPVSAKKKEEMDKRQKEKQRLRAEREQKIQEEREKKRKEKEDTKLLKEKLRIEEKKRKQDEIDEKLKMKQDKKAKEEQERLDKLKQKEEEKQKKMELLSAKMDEKKRKEEDRLKKIEEKKKADEEEERKKNKVKQVFANFFIKNDQQTASMADEACGIFRPFEVMKGMTVASVVPDVASFHFNRDALESEMASQNCGELYLSELKTKKHVPLRKTKKDLRKNNEDIIIIVTDKDVPLCKAKLFKFTENIRPPYFGTWRKKSKVVKPKKPFAMDTVAFDYEVDSDEEWDEGGPGESLSGTEDEKESDDDYEVDNAFFVPHGYLSADEEKDEDKFDSIEEQQARLKMREIEFQEERKKKCYELKPKIVGCFWVSKQMDNPELQQPLLAFKAVILGAVPIHITFHGSIGGHENNSAKSPSDGKMAKRTSTVPAEAFPYLIRLLHANQNNKNSLIKEFQEFWKQHSETEPEKQEPSIEGENPLLLTIEKTDKTPSPSQAFHISKRQLMLTIQNMASWMRRPHPNLNYHCWWVNEETQKEHNCKDLPVPNNWSYVTQIETGSNPATPSSATLKQAKSSPKPNLDSEDVVAAAVTKLTPSILKFTKKISEIEKSQNKENKDAKTNVELTGIPKIMLDCDNVLNPTENSETVNEIKKDCSTPSVLQLWSRKRDSNGLVVMPKKLVCDGEVAKAAEEDMSIANSNKIEVGTHSILKFMKGKKDTINDSPPALKKTVIDNDMITRMKETIEAVVAYESFTTVKSPNSGTPSIMKFLKRNKPDEESPLKVKSRYVNNEGKIGSPIVSDHRVIEID